MTDRDRELAEGECRGECAWGPSEGTIRGEKLFACGSCGSEWVASETWTPRNADGEINPEVAAEREANPISSSPW